MKLLIADDEQGIREVIKEYGMLENYAEIKDRINEKYTKYQDAYRLYELNSNLYKNININQYYYRTPQKDDNGLELHDENGETIYRTTLDKKKYDSDKEDYLCGLKNGLEIVVTVDGKGLLVKN